LVFAAVAPSIMSYLRLDFFTAPTMPIPDYQSLMLPVLRLAAEGERPIRECTAIVADQFGLSAEERDELIPSGRQPLLYNRVHWAVTYMVKAGLLERPRRGFIIATSRGHAILGESPERVDNQLLERFDEFQEFRRRSRSGTSIVPDGEPAVAVSATDDAGTPEDRITAAAQELNTSLREELLDRIVSAEPTFFEHLIIDLMVAMNYGGPGSGRHLGRTSDGGIDGIIRADPLGLDLVFLQAKRYAAGNGIGVDKIREFAGSLDERGAVKGVFVTTSHFAPAARHYAERSPKRLILIDGEELTKLLVSYGVGVRTFQKVELKRIDLDYFSLPDE
jgi:restriction system protein